MPLIPTGERLGLLTRIAVTERVCVARANEKLTAFMELVACEAKPYMKIRRHPTRQLRTVSL